MRTPLSTSPLLRGTLVTLRQVTLEDASDVREFTAYDGRFAETDEEAAGMLRRIAEDQERGDSVHWGVCPVDIDEVVGTCGFYRGFAGQVGEIGYVLGERFRGRGLMSEAVRLIVGFGFEVLNLQVVMASVESTNLASIAVLRRCGFTKVESNDGLLRFELPAREFEQ